MRYEFGLYWIARKSEVTQVDVVVDVLRRRVAAVGVVDNEQPAGLVRQKHRPMVKQAAGVVKLDRFAPLVALEAASEGQPVRSRVRRVARAELLAVGDPDAPLAVDADLGVGVAERPLVIWPRRAFLHAARRSRIGSRQLRDRPHQLAILEADDADGAAGIQRLPLAWSERPEVLAPKLRALFIRDPEPADGVLADGRSSAEPPGVQRVEMLYETNRVAPLKV